MWNLVHFTPLYSQPQIVCMFLYITVVRREKALYELFNECFCFFPPRPNVRPRDIKKHICLCECILRKERKREKIVVSGLKRESSQLKFGAFL